MTFDQIVARAMYRLNLTSEDARRSVEEGVNERYRTLTSDIGLVTARRTVLPFTIDPNDVDSILPDVTLDGLEKVLKVGRYVGTKLKTMDFVSYEEVTTKEPVRALPLSYAVKRMGAGVVTITLDGYPTTPFTLTVEGYDITDELHDDVEPFLPTDFHYMLVDGAMADELRKMEKADLAGIAEAKYVERLGKLRMFIAVNAYQTIKQGKVSQDVWPFNRISNG